MTSQAIFDNILNKICSLNFDNKQYNLTFKNKIMAKRSISLLPVGNLFPSIIFGKNVPRTKNQNL